MDKEKNGLGVNQLVGERQNRSLNWQIDLPGILLSLYDFWLILTITLFTVLKVREL